VDAARSLKHCLRWQSRFRLQQLDHHVVAGDEGLHISRVRASRNLGADDVDPFPTLWQHVITGRHNMVNDLVAHASCVAKLVEKDGQVRLGVAVIFAYVMRLPAVRHLDSHG
jgi:hypothetical protein